MQTFDLIRRVAACALAVFVVSCGGGSDTPAADPSAKATIGAAGGSLKSPDGTLTLTIPAGALGNDTQITITELAAANVPQPLKDLGADRVWRLGPDGQQFAQPAAVTIELPAGDEVVLLLHSSAGKTALADGAQLTVSAAGRTLTGQMGHFSDIATVRARGFEMPTLTVEPRDLEVGDATTSTFAIRKTASDIEADVSCTWEPNLLNTTILMETRSFAPRFSGVSLFRGTVLEVGGAVTYQCVAKGTRIVSAEFLLEAVAGFLMSNRTLLEGELRLVRAIDVVCRDKAPAATILVGTFALPFGMSQPDGATVVNGAFANLSGTGPHLLIAGSNGAVAMDLVTGLSSMNQTPSGPDGAFGNNLLGAQLISQPYPGANTPAALFGTTTGGSGSYLRNWDNTARVWGLTQISPGTTFIDTSNAGGGIVAEEMVIVSPNPGLRFVRFDTGLGFYNVFGVANLSTLQLGGTPQTAAMTEAAAGSPVLVGIPGVAGGANARVVVHPRGSVQQAVPLFDLGDAALGLMRCAAQAFAGQVPCIVTGGDKAYLFRYDPANPTAVPRVEVLDVGAGALGVQFGQRADGSLAAVVSNFAAGTLNIITFGADGAVAANRSKLLPAGVTGSAHAAPFAHGGKNYVAGTGNGSANYLVFEDN